MESKKILVVDDDADLVLATRLVLESAGYTVEETSTGEAGLEKMRAVTPDLVLMDIMVPNPLDGYHTTQQIADDPVLSKVPVLWSPQLRHRSTQRPSPPINTWPSGTSYRSPSNRSSYSPRSSATCSSTTAWHCAAADLSGWRLLRQQNPIAAMVLRRHGHPLLSHPDEFRGPAAGTCPSRLSPTPAVACSLR